MAVAFGLAGLAYWQRAIAVQQEAIAQEQRKAAEEQRDLAQQRRVAAVHQQASMLAQLANAELLRGDVDRALRVSVQGTRVDLALPVGTIAASPAAAQLAATVLQSD
jgi:hypothetical protein